MGESSKAFSGLENIDVGETGDNVIAGSGGIRGNLKGMIFGW